jgi:hypothetical protein
VAVFCYDGFQIVKIEAPYEGQGCADFNDFISAKKTAKAKASRKP